jgi:putative hemolysin
MLLEILVVLTLILVNGFLAMSELAIISSRKSRLGHYVNQGRRGARTALRLLEDQGHFLPTVQVGITFVGIIAGAFSGATLGRRIGAWLDAFPAISPNGPSLGVGITVVGITYLSLIFGELVPKRIALARPERIACVIAGPMWALSKAAAPAVWLLHWSTEAALRLFRVPASREISVTEDEVKFLIAEGTRAGIFVPQEQEMIKGVLRLADRPIRVVMTPRARIAWIDVHAGREAILEQMERGRFSRLLVCDGTVDHPVGSVHCRDLLVQTLRDRDLDLSASMAPPRFVPEQTTVLDLLDIFRREKTHLAIVIDEYGATDGLVTLTDILESIAGDLPEQGESPGPQIAQRADGSWLVDGAVPVDEVEAATGVEMGEDVSTLAGFVLHHLGRLPGPGAGFEYNNARFGVADTDGRRIDKVLITVNREPPRTDEPGTD